MKRMCGKDCFTEAMSQVMNDGGTSSTISQRKASTPMRAQNSTISSILSQVAVWKSQ